MRTDRLPLTSLDEYGNSVVDEGAEVSFPVYENESDPYTAEAELWMSGALIHRIPMRRMTAGLNGRFVYAPISLETRRSPGSSFEHTVNMAVVDVAVSGPGPTDPNWKPE